MSEHNEWIVKCTPEICENLARSFQQGPIIDDAGRRFLTEEQVAYLDGLKIEIFSHEHAPPHFRVKYSGETANYTIKDCTKLNGKLNKWDRNIRKWHGEHKDELISTWDRLRPSDCPVGKYKEET